MISVTAMVGKCLPSLRLKLHFQGVGHFLGGAFAFLFFAPLPLRQVIVGRLQSAQGGEAIDLLHKLSIEHYRDVVGSVLSFDLSRNFLPIEDLVIGHLGHTCPASRRNKSTAAEALAP